MTKVVRRSWDEVTVEVTVRLNGDLLEMESAIQETSNAAGRCVSEEALKRFDADGSPMRVGAIKLTARGRDPKEYQTPYGAVQVERYAYQKAPAAGASTARLSARPESCAGRRPFSPVSSATSTPSSTCARCKAGSAHRP